MSKTFRPWDVDQVWLLPPSIQDLVPPGHMAHFVRDTVRTGLDLSRIMDVYDEERGFPPYHPGMMVALLLYAYSQGIYSSRRIARGCEERLDFAAVTGMQRPDFRTISEFRKRHFRIVPAGSCAVPRGGAREAWPCGARRHQDQGQCRDQQGDELWPDESGRAEACGGGPALAGSGRPDRQG